MTTQSSRQTDGKKSPLSVYLLTFANGKCYVGVARHPDRRFRQHRKSAETGKPYAISNAWRKHGAPTLSILETTHSYEWAFALERAHILTLNTMAPNGYNMTSGGEGAVNLPPEMLKANAERRVQRFKEDAEFRAKMRAAGKLAGPKGAITRKAFNATPEGQAIIARRTGPEWKAKICAARKVQMTPAVREKMRIATKARWADPAYRDKVNAARDAKQAELRANDPEWAAKKAAKMAESMRKKWANDPEYRAKVLAHGAPTVLPEARTRGAAKRLEGMTPEVRAEIAEKTRQQWAKRKTSSSE